MIILCFTSKVAALSWKVRQKEGVNGLLIVAINGFMHTFGEVGETRDTALRRKDNTHPTPRGVTLGCQG